MGNIQRPTQELVSKCCYSEFDSLGFVREDDEGVYDEKCLKCGKRCELVWINPSFKSKEQLKDFFQEWAQSFHEKSFESAFLAGVLKGIDMSKEIVDSNFGLILKDKQ